MHDNRIHTDALVIGSGLAGGVAALELADMGYKVTLISAGDDLDDGNSALAQGGIVFKAPDNDPRQLEEDIMVAGWRHNYQSAVRYLSRRGPELVDRVLVDRLGVPFARTDECEWDLTMEGGHKAHRILHCADYTGRAIMDALTRELHKAPEITVLSKRTAIDILTSHHHSTSLDCMYHIRNQCAGAYVLNENTGEVETVLAHCTILAAGGVGRVYLHTTNAAPSIGSGLTMAYRAGARVMNAEFVQFHPTALYHKSDRRFLITEAMRGEGAKLVNAAGEPFMARYDERKDLAPRDVVSRAIMDEMLRKGEPYVYLDARYCSVDVAKRFPTIHKMCSSLGFDIENDPIPVVPAAHYFCGGVLADLKGRSTLERLYAVGECACTGVHGANRLASTSLLEALLWGHSAAQDIHHRLRSNFRLRPKLADSIPDWVSPGENRNEDPALVAQDWSNIRHTMWNYVGITRTTPRLQRAYDDLRNLYRHLVDFYKRTPVSKNLVDLFHGCYAAYIITMAAQRNKQSLGCHHRAEESE